MIHRARRERELEVRLVEVAPDKRAAKILEIRGPWAPFVVLPRVTVDAIVCEQLTRHEVIALRATTLLSIVTPHDLEVALGFSPEATQWILAGMVARDLLTPEGGGYVPGAAEVKEVSGETLVEKPKQMIRECVWFPETDEVLVLDATSSYARALRRLSAPAKYPVSGEDAGRPFDVVLLRALDRGGVHSRGLEAIRGLSAPGEVPSDVPAYRVSLQISAAVPESCQCQVLGIGTYQPEPLAKPEAVVQSVDLPSPLPPLLIEQCQDLARSALEQIRETRPTISGLTVSMADDGSLVATAGAEAIDALWSAALASDTIGVVILEPDNIEVTAHAIVIAEDDDTQRFLETDACIRDILSHSDGLDGFEDSMKENVVARLWSTGHFRYVYRIRESRDFTV